MPARAKSDVLVVVTIVTVSGIAALSRGRISCYAEFLRRSSFSSSTLPLQSHTPTSSSGEPSMLQGDPETLNELAPSPNPYTLSGPSPQWRSFADDAAPLHIHLPHLPDEQSRHANITLFVVPHDEQCKKRHNYACKFWFSVRCYVLAAFPRVHVIEKDDPVLAIRHLARDRDAVILFGRTSENTEIPDRLEELLHWRDEQPIDVRVGVFHVGDERFRRGFSWYSRPDFIIRNYWRSDLPDHVVYVPLGHQLPPDCVPERYEGLVQPQDLHIESCSCGTLSLPPISNRKYLWHFQGSLRSRRKGLLRELKRSAVLPLGFFNVSSRFGGDGHISTGDDPKYKYLDSLLQSKLVLAPCGNVMETHRIYEAIALGAVPVIENCEPELSQFFGVREVVVNGGPRELVDFVSSLSGDDEAIQGLQRKLQEWWREYTNEIARNVSKTIDQHIATQLRQEF